MNIEQERAAFEWWASDEGESPRATERAGGCYKLAQIQSYWVAWQARADLQSECEQLRQALVEARDLVAEWGAYADEYSKEKHGLERDIARLDAVISGEE